MSIYNKFAKAIAVIGLGQIALALRELIFLLLLSKFLGPTGYGLWTQANVIFLLLMDPVMPSAFALGLPAAITRFLAAEKDQQKIREGFYSVASVMVSIGLVMALILAFIAQPISNTLFEGEGTTVLRLVALAIPFSALYMASLSYFLTFREMRTFTFFVVLRCVGEVGIAAAWLKLGGGIDSVILSLVFAISVTGLAAFGVVAWKIGVKRPTFVYLKTYLRFGLPLVPTTLLFWVVQRSSILIVGGFLGPAVVGIYSAGYAIGTVLSMLRLPLLLALSPTISKLFDEGKMAQVKAHLRYALEYGLMLTIPAAVGISVLGKQLFEIFSVDEYAWEGSLVIPFVAASMVLYQVYGVLGAEVLKLVRKTNILAMAWVFGAVTSIGLNLFMVPRYGILGAASATLDAYVVVTIIVLSFSTRLFPVPVGWANIFKSLAASAVMAAVILFINPVKVWEVMAMIGLGVIIYGVVLVLLKAIGKNEFDFLVQSFKKGRLALERPE